MVRDFLLPLQGVRPVLECRVAEIRRIPDGRRSHLGGDLLIHMNDVLDGLRPLGRVAVDDGVPFGLVFTAVGLPLVLREAENTAGGELERLFPYEARDCPLQHNFIFRAGAAFLMYDLFVRELL